MRRVWEPLALLGRRLTRSLGALEQQARKSLGNVHSSAYRRGVAETPHGVGDSADNETPWDSAEPVDSIRFTVDRRAWQRFEAHNLRMRVQHELETTQNLCFESGSALDGDNHYLIGYGSALQELIVNRLFSTFDHLQLVTWTLESMDGPQIYSQYSLLRSALIGAATTHWLVSGDTTERRMRALRLAFYDLSQETTFAKLHAADPAMHSPERSEALGKTKTLIDSAPDRLDKIYQEYCRLRAHAGKTKMPSFEGFGKTNETEIIAAVSKTMYERGTFKYEKAVELQYRLMSGFVHTCTWATRAGAKTTTRVGKDRAIRQVRGNAENIYNGADTAYKIATMAKKRTLELAAKPQAS